VFRVTARCVRIPRVFSFDHSLGESAEAAPEAPCVAETDRVALSPPHCYSLRSLAERWGMCGPSLSHMGASRFVRSEGGCLVGARERSHQM
jgi:hypothetical protein